MQAGTAKSQTVEALVRRAVRGELDAAAPAAGLFAGQESQLAVQGTSMPDGATVLESAARSDTDRAAEDITPRFQIPWDDFERIHELVNRINGRVVEAARVVPAAWNALSKAYGWGPHEQTEAMKQPQRLLVLLR